ADLVRGAGRPGARMDRDAPAQVRQREGDLPVAAVGGADQLEERLVLRYGQQLALATHPAQGCEVAPEHVNLADVGLGHGQFWLGKMPCRAMDKLRTRYGCMFVWGWDPPTLPTLEACIGVRLVGAANGFAGAWRASTIPAGIAS